MTLAATFSLSDADLAAALTRALGWANRVSVTNEVLVSADGHTYSSNEQNWLTVPVPVILINGATPLVSYSVDNQVGSVNFPTAQTNAVISATFTFTPFTVTDLQAFIQDSFFSLEGRLGTSLDDTAVPRLLREALITQSHVLAMRSLQSGTPEYYSWMVDGRRVDKGGVTRHYDVIIQRQQKRVDDQLLWISHQYLDGGRLVFTR